MKENLIPCSSQDLGLHWCSTMRSTVHLSRDFPNSKILALSLILGYLLLMIIPSDYLARSRATVWLIKRLSPFFRNPKTLLTLFNSLVRSNLEYGSLLWSSSSIVFCDKVEWMQRYFLAFLRLLSVGLFLKRSL